MEQLVPKATWTLASTWEPALENRSMDIELALALEIDVLLDPPVQSDVRAINRMPLTLLGVIINHGQLLYSRNEEARINFEVGVRIAYFDFLPVIRPLPQGLPG